MPCSLRRPLTRALVRVLSRVAAGDVPAARRALHALAYEVAASTSTSPVIRLYLVDAIDSARTSLRDGDRDRVLQVLLPLLRPLLVDWTRGEAASARQSHA